VQSAARRADRVTVHPERSGAKSRGPSSLKSKQALWAYAAMAAAAALIVTVTPAPSTRNRLKGGAEALLVVGGDEGTPQREVTSDTPALLSVGERVRIGYVAGGHSFVAAISVDSQGVVSPLYPQQGQSLPVERGGQVAYLPDSLEFFGEGAERIVVVLTDMPLTLEQLKQAAAEAYARSGGDLEKLPALNLPGEQIHRTVIKPSKR
jgi:hypothetical protein